MAEEAAMMRSSAAQKQRIPSRSVEVKRSKRDASEADLSDRDDDDENDQGDPGEEDDGDEEVADLAENEDGEEEEEQEEVAESSTSAARKAKKARTEASASKAKSKRKTPTAGIVYISRLPPGMTPQKVRHLMARWGDVGKVYAQRRDGYNPNAAAANKKQKHKHRQADFTEAWVEFLDKTMAKTVARMLNAQVIGGKKGDRWRDDIWTMKYLSGFKWEMLGEQVAYERQAHQARLRNEITRSRAEQGDYLRNVELARVLAKRKQKKLDAGGEVAPINNGEGRVSGGQSDKAEKDGQEGRGYRQREVVDRGKAAKGAGMDDVLSSVFG